MSKPTKEVITPVDATIFELDETIRPESPLISSSTTPSKASSSAFQPGELASIAEIQKYLKKYSTTSTVFAEQSISNPDYQKTLYW